MLKSQTFPEKFKFADNDGGAVENTHESLPVGFQS